MTEITYHKPATLAEALALLAQDAEATAVLAGGTDLLVRIRDGKEAPRVLLDISGLGLNKIETSAQGLVLGAMTDLTSIEEHPLIRKQYQVLSESAREVGGLQTRNMGTIGGNICTGLPSADAAIPLLVLDAQFVIAGPRGQREIPGDQFFIGPRKIRLEQDELLTEIKIPPLTSLRFGSAFIKFGKRKAMRLCIMNIGVALTLADNSETISSFRAAMGTASPIPLRLYKTEAFVLGKQLSPVLLDEAVAIMETEISPRTSLRATREYRQILSRVLLRRAITLSVERARESGV